MRSKLAASFLTIFLLFGLAQTASATLLTSFTIDGNVGVEVAAYPDGYAYSSSGTLTLSGIPAGATIEQAWLYANNYFDASRTPSATFGGTVLANTIAFDVNDTFSVYKWDVTSLVTGSGSYSASYSGMTNSYGLALVVAYSDPGLPLSRVIINHGAFDLDGGGADTHTTTFNAFAGDGDLWIHTAADNNTGSESGEQIIFNGSVVGGPIDANLGNYASLFQLPVTAVNGTNTATIYTPIDYFGWDLAVLRTPSAAIPDPCTVFLLGSACLIGFAGLRRKFKE